jgi:hypothetical protein
MIMTPIDAVMIAIQVGLLTFSRSIGHARIAAKNGVVEIRNKVLATVVLVIENI